MFNGKFKTKGEEKNSQIGNFSLYLFRRLTSRYTCITGIFEKNSFSEETIKTLSSIWEGKHCTCWFKFL